MQLHAKVYVIPAIHIMSVYYSKMNSHASFSISVSVTCAYLNICADIFCPFHSNFALTSGSSNK